MSFLSRFRILTKILAIIVVMGGMAAAITFVGSNALRSVSVNADNMGVAAQRSLMAARARQNVLAISRAEFRSALDPRPENRSVARKIIEDNVKQFESRIDDLEKSKDERAQAMMPAVKAAFAAYQKDMENTLRLVDAVKDIQLSDTTIQLRDAVLKSRASAEELQNKIKTVAEDLENRVESLAKDSTAEYESASHMMIISSVVGIVLGLLLGFLIGQYGVAKPLAAIVDLLQLLAEGHFDVDIAGTDRKDEIGHVAKTALVFKENGLAKIRMEAEQKEAEQRAIMQRKQDMIKLADQFQGAVGEIIETVSSASTELEASASTLTATAVRAQEITTAVAAASEEASTNVQAVASATEEMASSVNEIGRQVQESARMAGEAVDQARKTNDRVSELSKAAARIGDVIELINTIAGQTNLLALNATIEAARAGEAGRGFAVVASEVKALAEQTAKATGEISQQITGIQAATQDSVGAIKEISNTIERLSEISSTIAAAVEEQGAATQEISRNVQQAAQGTQQVSSNITDVQRGAGETGSASSQVLSAAQLLSRDSNRLKQEVGEFLSTVRAA
ncbi:MAG: methyl-accepting chemotaxis protein [Bradyrhizobium sp.]|uniref:methyl-accepting chemotaxis protein n=1 Tax=Bradyrhizobium sp. TaxID=376 RepID=UPI00238B3C4F|nr:methyl-accepting chemotaxis protein [Bradyrhizobium sp.]MDE2600861.1 methyl-accepting chemotaxis protein [Bradyrhizobium sp.]